jgi:hypothetical protein
MLFDGIKLVEGSEFQNLVVDAGTSFPASPNPGEMFYRTDAPNIGLYVYDGSTWNRQANLDDLSALGGDYVLKVGDTMTGTLVLSGAPTADLHAATKKYVDDTTAAAVSSIPWSAITGEPTTLGGYGITDAQPLDGDLTAIANIAATSGLLRKIAANTWALDTATYITGNETITVTGDASGSGTTSITLTLATTGVAAGSYGTASAVPTIAVDSKGRITSVSNTSIAIDASAVTSGTFANSRISSSSVTQHQAALTILESQISDGSLLARVAGNETISGSWTFNNPVVGQSPSAPSHFATKDYVDNVAAGINPHAAVRVATTANITLSGTQTIDGVAVSAGDRVLVKNQTSAVDNGVYVVSAGTWTRAPDFDGSPSNEVATGDLVFVEEGTSNSNSSWVMVTPGTISVGVTPLNFSVFSRAGDFEAGDGLTKTGNTFNVGTASSSRIVVNVDNIDLAYTGVAPNTYASVTVDAYGRVTGGSTSQTWSSISSTPTTLAGYGITDAQSLDADLTALAGISTTGFLVRTGSGTATTRSVTVSGNGITLTNADGVSGDLTINSTAVSSNTPSSIVYRDASGNFAAGTITATLAGNASTATTWATGRTISITGDVTGTSGTFDGSANASIAVSLPTINSNVGTFGSSTIVPVITVNAKGQVTAVNTATITAGATVAGASTQIQYNTSGSLDASSDFTWNNTTKTLGLGVGTPSAVTVSTGGGLTVTLGGTTSSNLSMTAGSSNSSSAAGQVTVQGGANTSTGAGGKVIIQGGSSTSGVAGDLDLRAGISSSGTGGMFLVSTGATTSLTERFRIANNGAWGLGGANYGTSGYVLTSNGSSGPPTWQAAGSGLPSGLSFSNPTFTVATSGGGIITTGGNGTILTVRGGDSSGSAATNSLTLAGGIAGSGGNGGGISIAAAGSSGSGTGGPVAITGGNASGSGNAGNITLTAGTSSTGSPGSISITSGNTISGNAGSINISSGVNTSSGRGGPINITVSSTTGYPDCGISMTVSDGTTAGSVTITGGSSGSTTGGSVTLAGGSGPAQYGGNINLNPAAGSTANGVIVFNGAHKEKHTTINPYTSVTLNCSLSNYFLITPQSSSLSISFSNAPSYGWAYEMTVVIFQLSTISITWPSSVKWAGGSQPTLSGSSKLDIFKLVTFDGGGSWYGTTFAQNITY